MIMFISTSLLYLDIGPQNRVILSPHPSITLLTTLPQTTPPTLHQRLITLHTQKCPPRSNSLLPTTLQTAPINSHSSIKISLKNALIPRHTTPFCKRFFLSSYIAQTQIRKRFHSIVTRRCGGDPVRYVEFRSSVGGVV